MATGRSAVAARHRTHSLTPALPFAPADAFAHNFPSPAHNSLKRVRDGNLLHPFRSQSPELLPGPISNPRPICRACARSVPSTRTPPLPHFCRNPLNTSKLQVKMPVSPDFTHRNKGLICSPFSRLSKSKALTASTEGSRSLSRNPLPNSPEHTNSGFTLNSCEIAP